MYVYQFMKFIQYLVIGKIVIFFINVIYLLTYLFISLCFYLFICFIYVDGSPDNLPTFFFLSLSLCLIYSYPLYLFHCISFLYIQFSSFFLSLSFLSPIFLILNFSILSLFLHFCALLFFIIQFSHIIFPVSIIYIFFSLFHRLPFHFLCNPSLQLPIFSLQDENSKFFYIDLWSSVYTWGDQPVPSEGQLVLVEEGMTVLIDESTPVLKMLLLDGMALLSWLSHYIY